MFNPNIPDGLIPIDIDEQKQCWICGEEADSKEHKIKKSDLKLRHGSGEDFRSQELMHRGLDGSPRKLQGVNSNLVKFDKFICKKCNNQLTQPHDNAYEKFMDYVIINKKLIVKNKVINLNDVFQIDCQANTENLYKYCVKHFGCKLRECEYKVPKDVVNIIKNNVVDTYLCLTFSIDLPCEVIYINSHIGANNSYAVMQYNFDYFKVTMWYSRLPHQPFGNESTMWFANSDIIKLNDVNSDLNEFSVIKEAAFMPLTYNDYHTKLVEFQQKRK